MIFTSPRAFVRSIARRAAENVSLLRLSESAIARAGVGRKFQRPTVFEDQTVFENLAMALKKDRGPLAVLLFLAGLAIENSMLGAAHALANPLTATYGIVHGQAIGLMLPHVIRFNAVEVGDWYQDLLNSACDGNGFPAPSSGPDGLADYVADLVRQAELPGRLSECDVQRERLPELAEAAATQWTGTFNPRPVDAEALFGVYEQAF